MEQKPCPTCGYQMDRVDSINNENARLRVALRQIAFDCGKVLDDEVCSESERRTWKAVGRFALHAALEK
jgi:tRNA U54 and U55 pseudouridine synthase Pus10